MRVGFSTVALLFVICSASVSADVKIVEQIGGRLAKDGTPEESVTYIKGRRMRTDVTVGGRRLTTILNIDTGERIVLDHGQKQAEITSAAGPARNGGGRASWKIKPNGKTREIAGHPAVGYDMELKLSFLSLKGWAFVSATAPGAGDYKDLVTGAAAKGIAVSDAGSNEQSGGEAPSLLEAIVDKGVPLETRLTLKGAKLGLVGPTPSLGDITTRVTSLSSEPLADDLFAVPTGYNVNRKKVD